MSAKTRGQWRNHGGAKWASAIPFAKPLKKFNSNTQACKFVLLNLGDLLKNLIKLINYFILVI